MNLEKIEKNGIVIAAVCVSDICVSDSASAPQTPPVITDVDSALDLLMTAKYDVGTKNIMIAKELVTEDFFILSRGLAGEILQKYINYGGRLAIYGDYSGYTSKPLRDFIYESNQGIDFFFVATREEAMNCLAGITH